MLRFPIALARKRLQIASIKGRYNAPQRIGTQYSFAPLSNIAPKNTDPETQKPSTEKKSLATTITATLKGALNSTVDMVRNPKETWKMIKEVANHYWLGSKLLWSDIKVAWDIARRVSQGHSMTRRERIQLIRTTSDIFRLVPFSIFIIVPFMELLLPFALKLFPNMLPSTFQDSLKAEEAMKKELQMRLAVAQFMQETLQQMAEKKKSSAGKAADKEAASGATEVIEFVEKARRGEHIPNDQVLRIAKLFKDELTLDNVPRQQLIGMCRYMGLQPYGNDPFLRFQLRSKLRALQEDDRRILWEGIDSLNTIELRDACRERGMRSIGMTQFRLKKQLQEWLELSTQKGIPIFLLIASRAFMLNAAAVEPTQAGAAVQPSDPDQVLKSSMSFLDADTINEVVLGAASTTEADTPEMRRRRLESIQFQKELMEEERHGQEEATKARKTAVLSTSGGAPPHAAGLPEERAGNRTAVSTTMPAPNTSSTSALIHKPSAEIVAVLQPADAAGGSQSPAAGDASEGEDIVGPAEKPELTIHDLVTLSDLARENSLRREMSELAVLEAFIKSLPIDSSAAERAAAAEPSLTGETAAPAGHAAADDKSVERMKSVISKMVGNLKVKINTTEKVLGDKLKVLDRDNDGQISYDEIRSVVSTVMRKGAATEEHVAQLFDALDSNKDGKVSVAELLQYIHRKKESSEFELMEEQMKAAAAEAAAAKSSAHSTSPAPSRSSVDETSKKTL